MAAYAALASLMNTMEDVKNHPRLSTSLDKKQTESLGERIDFLLNFMENFSHGSSKEAEELESQIASAAYAAEDVIETHVVDRILAGSTEESCSFLLDLQEVIKDMDSIKERVIEERQFKDLQPTYSKPIMPSTSSKPLTIGNSTMVGFDDELIQLLDGLTGQQSNRQVISIVGMGGIGKTTLARNAFEHSLTIQHFDLRAWVTVSQDYSVKGILLQLLSRQENSERLMAMDENKLSEKLYKNLSGRRYLVIIDDMWSIEVWDKIKFFLPDNDNRSRVVVTTRLTNVAIHFGSSYLTMNFLDEDKSWNLFCKKIFVQEDCPPELENIGKQIAKKCKGLPLAIVVMAGHLRSSYTTQEYWKSVAKDINSILNLGEDEQYFNILSWSYAHLPVHLKPCFLYMGIFPEDHLIDVSQLIKLWVAEGFLKPNTAQSAEEVAEDYLKDLVDRNLLLVHSMRFNGKMKTCSIHDLLRDLCLRIAEKEKFLCITRDLDVRPVIDNERRVVVHQSNSKKYQTASLSRSLICKGTSQLSLKSRLLKVLDVFGSDLRDDIFKHVNLRYISYNPQYLMISKLPSSISLLWNVQTLIFIRGCVRGIVAPSEIWKMPQLRHLQFDAICFLDPSTHDCVGQEDDFVLQNLQTLRKIMNFRLSEEVCKRIPNVKKLYLVYINFSERSNYYCLHNLGRFYKLESLNCSFRNAPTRDDLLHNFTFPSSLQKLSLENCCLCWEDLTMIGSLPHLEALKLGMNSITGHEWNPIEGEFLCLRILSIRYCSDLIYWNADSSHFPVLETLVLESMHQLDEIPSDIGEIPTLRFINLVYCSASAIISTMKILEEQEDLGNDGLQVRVEIWDEEDLESLKEKVELDSFTSKNFQLEVAF